MLDKMKFVVPFMMPMISSMRLLLSDEYIGRTMGMPPATLASNWKSTLCCCDNFNSGMP